MALSKTEEEMQDAGRIFNEIYLEKIGDLADEIKDKRIIFIGMGSSVIFPGRNAKERSLKLNIKNKVEVFFASELFALDDFSNTYVFLCSNSGRTKETNLLFDYCKKRGAECIVITAFEDSMLAKKSDKKIILTNSIEGGVAATKSVIEMALLYDLLINILARNQGKDINVNEIGAEMKKIPEIFNENLNYEIGTEILNTMVNSNKIFIVGQDNGLAEEATLKCIEILRKDARFYPDTHIVHGPEEIISENDLVIIIKPNAFKDYLNDFEKVKNNTGCKIICLDENESIFPTVIVKSNRLFENYCYLVSSWNLFRRVANRLKIDIDHPKKISKVGNPLIR